MHSLAAAEEHGVGHRRSGEVTDQVADLRVDAVLAVAGRCLLEPKRTSVTSSPLTIIRSTDCVLSMQRTLPLMDRFGQLTFAVQLLSNNDCFCDTVPVGQ